MGILDAPEWVETIPEPDRGGATPKLKFVLEKLAAEEKVGQWAKIATYKSRKSASASASYARRRYGEAFEFACRDTEVYARIK